MYLPGLWSIPPVDRDECRFAQASRQMFEAHAWPADRLDPALHAGGWAVPMLVDRPRLNKPPLVYWLQVGSAWVFTLGRPELDEMWMYRVPSVACAVLAVLGTWSFARRWMDPRAAFLGGAVLAVSPMVVWDAHQARADQLLLACTTLAMLALFGTWRAARRRPWALPMVFWAAMAAGIMAKGFVTPMIAGCAVLAIGLATRRWGWVWSLRPGVGLVVLAGATIPWLLGVAQQQGGLGAYARLVWEEFFVRGATGSREGHFAPPGAHTLLLAVLFWPGSLLTLAAIPAAIRRAKGAGGSWRGGFRGREIELFLLAWIVPAWVVFELSPAKLPHYTMPMYPAVALLSARMALRVAARPALAAAALNLPARVAWSAIGLAMPVACAAATGWMLLQGLHHAKFGMSALGLAGGVMPMLASVLAAGLVLRAGWLLARGRPVGALALGIVASLTLLPVTLGLVAPALVPGGQSAWLGAMLEARQAGGSRPIVSVLHEDSLIFATRGRAQRVSLEQARDALAQRAGVLAVVPADEAWQTRANTPGSGLIVTAWWKPPALFPDRREWMIVERTR